MKYLQLKNPCDKAWAGMRENPKGRHCTFCTKTVIDFTHLSDAEILEKLQSAKNGICARVRLAQLDKPLVPPSPIIKTPRPPYAKIVVGLLLATFSIGTLACDTPFPKAPQHLAQAPSSGEENERPPQKTPQPKPNAPFIFKGRALSKTTGRPLANATVSFVTIHHAVTTKAAEDGCFTLEIPSQLLHDTRNVIQFSFEDVKDDPGVPLEYYETSQLVFEKEQLGVPYTHLAENERMMLGGVHLYDYLEEPKIPIVLEHGEEISYEEFDFALNGGKNASSEKWTDFYHFHGEAAVALYGKEAAHGLILLVKETHK